MTEAEGFSEPVLWVLPLVMGICSGLCKGTQAVWILGQ